MSTFDQRGQQVETQYNIAQAAAEKPPVFVDVPRMPNHFVGREAQVADLVQKLCDGGSDVAVRGGAARCGQDDAGHRTGAPSRACWPISRTACCGPASVRHADASGALLAWADALDVDLTDIAEDKDRSERLRRAINDRALLIVIDDAWEWEPADLLRCGGPNCVHLLTTRDQRLAEKFAGRVERVEELAPDAAWELLQALAPKACAANPERAGALLEAVGYLPLAIELLGGYLNAGARHNYASESEQALNDLAEPARRLELACQRIGSDGEMTLAQIIELSLDGVREESADAVDVFYRLGAFAPNRRASHWKRRSP